MTADAARNLLSLGTGTRTIAGRSGIVGAGRGGGQMRDVLGDGMLGTDVGDADVGGFTGFAQGIIAGIEVFALLMITGYMLDEWRDGGMGRRGG